jgi:hypothetical protein
MLCYTVKPISKIKKELKTTYILSYGLNFYNKLLPIQMKYSITIYLTEANLMLIKL